MITNWTNDEIEKILVQLDNMGLPFDKYRLSKLGQGLKLLGTGSYANVYEAKKRNPDKNNYAVKIIGFDDRHIQSETFAQMVRMQKQMGQFQENIVKVYDYVQLKVWIENGTHITRVEKVNNSEKDIESEDCLILQFLVMEKLTSVLSTNRYGKRCLNPSRLASFDENEILQLAHDIGSALDYAHQEKILHRDIKLENIFYDEKKKCYKLGDFGIAKVTDDGMAQTRAFTKGYGAPEVIEALDEKYDNTADIYSLGTVIYILLNKLCFPGAKGYCVDVANQYSRGYIFPAPATGSKEFYKIVEKMCRYHPDNRYQSIKDCLTELDGIMVNKMVQYKEEHQMSSFIMGMILLLAGSVMWKLTFAPQFNLTLSFWMYVFLIMACTQGLIKTSRLKPFISTGMLVLGVILLFESGFCWWKAVLLLGMWTFDKFSGAVAGTILAVNLTTIITINSNVGISWINEMREYQWVTITLLLMAAVMFLQYFTLIMRAQKVTAYYFRRNLFWVIVLVLCVALCSIGFSLQVNGAFAWKKMFGNDLVRQMISLNMHKIGIAGIGIALFWNIREYVLVKLDKK